MALVLPSLVPPCFSQGRTRLSLRVSASSLFWQWSIPIRSCTRAVVVTRLGQKLGECYKREFYDMRLRPPAHWMKLLIVSAITGTPSTANAKSSESFKRHAVRTAASCQPVVCLLLRGVPKTVLGRKIFRPKRMISRVPHHLFAGLDAVARAWKA